jgi:hypothetical protein
MNTLLKNNHILFIISVPAELYVFYVGRSHRETQGAQSYTKNFYDGFESMPAQIEYRRIYL